MKKIFSELKGFVIYNPDLLAKYLQENNLPGTNILKYFVENEHGDEITKLGIAIPVIGVEEDYYTFSISAPGQPILAPEEVAVQSEDWVFRSTNHEMKIVGIGYLKDISSITDENSISLSIENGWFSLKIQGGMKNGERLFELIIQKQDSKPIFNGDLTTEYYYR